MKKAGLRQQGKYYQRRRTETDAYLAAIQTDNQELAFILDTLQRQRIIEEEYGIARGESDENVEVGSLWRISELGVRFVEACRPPKETQP